MATPLTTKGASSEPGAWQELEEVVATLAQLARSAIAPHEFYRTLLDESVRAVAAEGGVVWLRAVGGVMQPLLQANWPGAQFAGDETARRNHEALLADAAAEGRVTIVAPNARREETGSANPTNRVLVLGPVKVSPHAATAHAEATTKTRLTASTHPISETRAIIELALRPDAGPAVYRGCEQFLTAVSELAADYHTFEDLRHLQLNEEYRVQLLDLSREVHRHLNLSETAYAVANEGRRIIGCGRLNVLVTRGRRCRLIATSGASRIDRRSGAARRLEKLAKQIVRTDEPAYYADAESDAMPPVAKALEAHAEESHARQVAAIPLHRPTDKSQEDFETGSGRAKRKRHRPQFVLVAEQFDSRYGELSRDRLVEVGEVVTTALHHALDYDRLPLGWLLRPLGTALRSVASHLPRTLFIAAAIAAAAWSLVYVQTDFNIDATGTLEPVVSHDVFAPRSGLIDEVLVKHGTEVKAGEPLVRMSDSKLELELKRVDGELETAQRQLEAVRATRTNRAVREANPADAYRLSAEEREIEQRLANLRRELDLLNKERKQLVVTSPIAGQVLTWEVGHRLGARPVERGEVLVTVADLAADWQLDLNVPDDRMGYVFAAQQAIKPELPVRFRLSSDDREQHLGHIAEIGQMADVSNEGGATPSATVLVKVALDSLDLTEAARRELRPGVSARAQIECGRRSLGYVWLHDIWDKAVEWWEF